MHRLVCSCSLFLAAAVVVLPGCYKSQFETEKTRAEDLHKKSKEVQAQLDAAKRELGTAQARTQQLEAQLSGLRAGGTLVSYIDGKPAGRESIRWDGTQWVRQGDSSRAGGTIKFDNGRLADQTLMVSQAGDKPWYTGAVKFGKPEGEWIWFDEGGKPHMREVWAAGRLVEVGKASTAKGPLTWNKLGPKDREAWVKTTSAALRDLPELARETSAPVAAPTAAAPKAASPLPPLPAAKKGAKPGR